MANWRATINIKTEWKASEADKEKVTELVTAVVAWMDRSLKSGVFKDDPDLEELRDEFKALLHSATHTRHTVKWGKTRIAKFDGIWNSLYNWCDSNLVWVKTF